MQQKRNNQNSSCPEGYHPAGTSIPLRLTKRQEKYAGRAIGISRAVYNTMVATHQLARAHGHGPWPSPMETEKLFNQLKHDPAFGMTFTTQVSKFVAQGACRDFRNAYNRWRDPDQKAGKPVFHKKNANGTGSFLATSGVDRIKYDGHRRITLSYLGSIKLKRELPTGIPYQATIRKQLGQWELSLNYWKPPEDAELKTHEAGAADVGIQPLAVDSELNHYENPQPLYKYLKQLARWQKKQDRRQKGSRGWHEAQDRLNSIWRKILGLRNNLHHQLSRLLVRKYQVLCIESLNVAGMDKLKGQAKAIRDAAIGNLLRLIKYKADWHGTLIVEADRFFPSSKTCNACGCINQELKREKYWTCPECGTPHERNENAVLNLLKLALEAARDLPKSTLGAVGPDVTLPDAKALTDPVPSRKGRGTGRETGTDEGRTGRTILPSAGSRRQRKLDAGGLKHPAQAGSVTNAYNPDNPLIT